jgi:hypothetical protein
VNCGKPDFRGHYLGSAYYWRLLPTDMEQQIRRLKSSIHSNVLFICSKNLMLHFKMYKTNFVMSDRPLAAVQ